MLKLAAKAHQALAELKGVVTSIPNQAILIHTLSLQEAKASPPTKEVFAYAVALRNGYAVIKEKGLLTNTLILEIQAELEENKAGFRKLPGTALKHELTGKTVYTPPQNGANIQRYMGNLETFINDDALCDWDPLVKMTVIHHQFESIHPFYDRNGRTGRIIISCTWFRSVC